MYVILTDNDRVLLLLALWILVNDNLTCVYSIHWQPTYKDAPHRHRADCIHSPYPTLEGPIYHYTELFQDRYLYNLGHKIVDQVDKDCSLHDVVYFSQSAVHTQHF